MGEGLRVVLLLFALVGYAGAGAALAVARFRWLNGRERDPGMLGVAAMLGAFGALCTAVGTGLAGVLAFGAVAVWASYLFMARRMGMFRIEAGRPRRTEEEPAEEHHWTP